MVVRVRLGDDGFKIFVLRLRDRWRRQLLLLLLLLRLLVGGLPRRLFAALSILFLFLLLLLPLLLWSALQIPLFLPILLLLLPHTLPYIPTHNSQSRCQTLNSMTGKPTVVALGNSILQFPSLLLRRGFAQRLLKLFSVVVVVVSHPQRRVGPQDRLRKRRKSNLN